MLLNNIVFKSETNSGDFKSFFIKSNIGTHFISYWIY